MDNSNNSAALRALAATGLSNNGNNGAPTVIVQPAQFAEGCEPGCSLTPTPSSTLLATSQRGRLCQITFKDLGPGTYIFGQGNWSFSADPLVPATDNLLRATNIIPNNIYNGTSGNLSNQALNFLSQNFTYVIGCMNIVFTSGTADQRETAAAAPLMLNHSDAFKPFEPCDPTTLYPGCNTCVGGPVIQSFNNCAMFIGPLDCIIYTIGEGVRANITFNVVSVDTVTNQVPC